MMVRATGLEPARTCQDAADLESAVSAFPPRPQARKGGAERPLPVAFVVVLESESKARPNLPAVILAPPNYPIY
jgi:hypothetical protein